ncbi:MAG: hypothetical protein ABIO05_06410 [Ferruginibacter sp.]
MDFLPALVFKINNLVDIKSIYYKYVKAPEIDYGLPIYQFTYNYMRVKIKDGIKEVST